MTGSLPLDGIRVADFTSGLAGPLAAMVLGDLGADVVKVEQVGKGDLSRDLFSPSLFLASNRNKRSVAVDLKHPTGLEMALRLVASADVLVESFRPGIMDSLGLGAEAVMAANPGLVYASFSGFGSAGPHRKRRAVDAVAQAEMGMTAANGGVEAPFTPVDTTSGLVLAQAVLAALVKRARTGRGGRVDAALVGVALQLQAVAIVEYGLSGEVLTPTERARRAPSSGLFQAKEGVVYVAAHYEEHWRSLCRVLGGAELIDDPRYADRDSRMKNGDQLQAALGRLFAARTPIAWVELLTAEGVMAAVVRDYEAVLTEEAGPGHRWLVEAPSSDGAAITMAALPYTIAGETLPVRLGAPRLGEHTAEVLAGLGYAEHEIAAAAAEHAVQLARAGPPKAPESTAGGGAGAPTARRSSGLGPRAGAPKAPE